MRTRPIFSWILLSDFVLRENQNVRVVGSLKTFGSKRYVNATQIRVAEDIHEVFFHILECVTSTLIADRGPVRFYCLVFMLFLDIYCSLSPVSNQSNRTDSLSLGQVRRRISLIRHSRSRMTNTHIYRNYSATSCTSCSSRRTARKGSTSHPLLVLLVVAMHKRSGR